MKYPIPEEDLNKDDLCYDVEIYNENYIKWITRGEGGYFNKDSSTGLYAENNNNVAATSQGNIFTNENQSNTDILAASAGYNTSNVTNECFTAPLLLQETTSISRNPNIEQSASRYVVNETSDENTSQDTDDLDIYPKFQEHDAQEEPQDSINRELDACETSIKTLLLENKELENNLETDIETLLLENKELENRLRKAQNKTYDTNTEIENIQEQQDNMMNTDTSDEPKDTVKEEPQDNMRNKDTSDEPKDTDEKWSQDDMRNKKKPKTYDYNLFLPSIKTVKNEQIDNKESTLGFSYQHS